MKKKLIISLCILLLSMSACGKQESKETESDNKNPKTEQTTQTLDGEQTEDSTANPVKHESESPMDELDNTAPSANEIFQTEENHSTANVGEMQELSVEEMYSRFYQRFYGTDGSMPDVSEVIHEVLTGDRLRMNLHSKYNSDINYYWENILGVTDVTPTIDPLFFTDMKYYTIEDFKNLPPTVIHIAKNEIYAKHGYIFKDEDLNQYFLGCAWYQPRVTSEEFDDSVFNQYEKANLKILAELDK